MALKTNDLFYINNPHYECVMATRVLCFKTLTTTIKEVEADWTVKLMTVDSQESISGLKCSNL